MPANSHHNVGMSEPSDEVAPAYEMYTASQGMRGGVSTSHVSTIEQVTLPDSPTATLNTSIPAGPYQHESRPFTARIDELIEQEKYGNSAMVNSDVGNGPSLAAKGKLFGVGPLDKPILSSTIRSGMTSSQTDPTTELQSGLNSGHFEPLRPDSSLRTSYTHQSSGPHVSPALQSNGGTIDAGAYENTIAAAFHDQMNDREFFSYYQRLAPEERQQQLLIQKEALLHEQHRLRGVLDEQEALLHSKQEQLHMQQEIQKNRLRFFEQTGVFPPSAMFGNPQLPVTGSYSVEAPQCPHTHYTQLDCERFYPYSSATEAPLVDQLPHTVHPTSHTERYRSFPTDSTTMTEPDFTGKYLGRSEHINGHDSDYNVPSDPYQERWPDRPVTPETHDAKGTYMYILVCTRFLFS